MLGFIQISAVSLIEISTYSQYQQREKRSKKEKITTTILVFYQKTTMVIIGIVLMSAYKPGLMLKLKRNKELARVISIIDFQ